MNNRLRPVFASLLAIALLNACGGGGGLGSDSSVRLVNATDGTAPLDLYAGSDRLSSGTPAYSAGGYASTNTGDFTFSLAANGSPSVSGTLDKRKHATVLAYTSAGAQTLSFLTDEEGSPDSNKAKLRIFNTANTEAGPLDVYLVTTQCSTLASSSTAATASAVAGTAPTSYTQVSTGSYHLCVSANGDKTDLRLDLPTFTLNDQDVVTLILTRTSGGLLVNALALQQQGGLTKNLNPSARLRLSAGVTGGTVVAMANGAPVATSTSPKVSGYQLVPAGSLTLSITVSGVATPLTGQSIAAGSDNTLLVAGTLAAPVATLITDDNTLSNATSKPVKIRVVNGFVGASALTLDIDGNTVGGTATFGAASTPGFTPVSDALSELQVTDADGNQLYDKTGVTLTSGKVYTLFLLGTLPTPPGGDTGILRIDR